MIDFERKVVRKETSTHYPYTAEVPFADIHPNLPERAPHLRSMVATYIAANLHTKIADAQNHLNLEPASLTDDEAGQFINIMYVARMFDQGTPLKWGAWLFEVQETAEAIMLSEDDKGGTDGSE